MPAKLFSRKHRSAIKLGIYGGALGYWGPLNPTVLESDRMIGGAECAMIHVSRGLARLGYNVTVFYSQVDQPGVYDGVRWVNAQEYDPRECYDVLISWDAMLDGIGVFKLMPAAHLRVLEMQCNHPAIQPQHRVDWVTPKSEWHKRVIRLFNPTIPEERCYIMPNGVDLNRYNRPECRIPGRVIWSSSPDRGLHHLLRIWPQVLAEVPEATLHVFYEFDRSFESIKWQMNIQAANMWYIKTHLDQPGVVFRGGVGQQALAKEQKQAMLLAYPCDTVRPSEGFCITILECMAAGTPVLTSDADALLELWSPGAMILPRPIHDEAWVAAIVRFLRDETLWQKYAQLGKKLAPAYSWDVVVARWDEFLQAKLREKKT